MPGTRWGQIAISKGAIPDRYLPTGPLVKSVKLTDLFISTADCEQMLQSDTINICPSEVTSDCGPLTALIIFRDVSGV
jgi:hypothetical protein